MIVLCAKVGRRHQNTENNTPARLRRAGVCFSCGKMAKCNIYMPRKRGKILSIIIIFIVVLLLGKFLSNSLSSVFQEIFSPVQKYFWDKGQKTDTFFFYFFNAKSIYAQNQNLKQENIILNQKNNELVGLYQENEKLRQAFRLAEQEKFNLFPCSIIAKQAGKDVILIDKGSKHGLLQGMPVITSNGILIGTIKKANTNFSEVILITSKDFSFDVSIHITSETSTQVLALAKGEGGFGLSLNYADKLISIPEKSLVFTSSMGGNFPKGLLIGEIEKIESNPAELFQAGKINPYLKENLFSNVFVIQNFQSIKSQ